jgi:type VI secretion system secreted protein Hcp
MAYEFYVTVKGAKAGDFKGESPRKGQEKKMPAFAFEAGILSPRDAASGHATGKRQHKPLVFMKRVGASTPQWVQAVCTNEQLTSVFFEFYESDQKSAAEHIFFTIKLTNASVASHRIIQSISEPGSTKPDAVLHEEISLTFEKIEWEHKIAKSMAEDNWMDRAG